MNLSRAAWLRLLPFAAFMGLLALRGMAPTDDRWGFDTRWLYAANLLVVGGMLALWWRDYGELARPNWPDPREIAAGRGRGPGGVCAVDPPGRALDADRRAHRRPSCRWTLTASCCGR